MENYREETEKLDPQSKNTERKCWQCLQCVKETCFIRAGKRMQNMFRCQLPFMVFSYFMSLNTTTYNMYNIIYERYWSLDVKPRQSVDTKSYFEFCTFKSGTWMFKLHDTWFSKKLRIFTEHLKAEEALLFQKLNLLTFAVSVGRKTKVCENS